jgi:hypothetical protein
MDAGFYRDDSYQKGVIPFLFHLILFTSEENIHLTLLFQALHKPAFQFPACHLPQLNLA